MKVLHVTLSISPRRGGPSEVVLNLVRALRHQGIDAEIATTTDNGSDGSPPLDVPLNQRVHYAGVPIWFFPQSVPSLGKLSLGRDRGFVFSAALTHWLWHQSRNYDILDTHYLFSYPSTCAGMVARLQGIPYTVRAMGQLSSWALAQSRLKKQLYAFLIERCNLNRAAGVHCTSIGEADDVRAFGVQAPLITLPLGVEPPLPQTAAGQRLRQRYGIAPEVPIVLFMSRLHYKKRPDLLLQALAKLIPESCSFHLILAGSGEPEYTRYLQELATFLGLDQRTTFPGFVTGEDKHLLLQGSDLFALPSHSENFGIAVAEAMMAGLPVLVTPDVQIAPEVATIEAGLVIAGDIEAWAASLKTLLLHPELRQQMGNRGRHYALQHYSWDEIARKLTTTYQAIIQKQNFTLGCPV